MNETILDTDQAVEFLKLSKTRIYQLKALEKIPYHTIGDKILFIKDELIEWVRNNGKMEVQS